MRSEQHRWKIRVQKKKSYEKARKTYTKLSKAYNSSLPSILNSKTLISLKMVTIFATLHSGLGSGCPGNKSIVK